MFPKNPMLGDLTRHGVESIKVLATGETVAEFKKWSGVVTCSHGKRLMRRENRTLKIMQWVCSFYSSESRAHREYCAYQILPGHSAKKGIVLPFFDQNDLTDMMAKQRLYGVKVDVHPNNLMSGVMPEPTPLCTGCRICAELLTEQAAPKPTAVVRYQPSRVREMDTRMTEPTELN